MTTKVKIENMDKGHSVCVSQIYLLEDGVASKPSPLAVVKAGESIEVHIHQGVKLEISELKE